MPVRRTHFHLGHIFGMDPESDGRIEHDKKENNGTNNMQAMHERNGNYKRTRRISYKVDPLPGHFSPALNLSN